MFPFILLCKILLACLVSIIYVGFSETEEILLCKISRKKNPFFYENVPGKIKGALEKGDAKRRFFRISEGNPPPFNGISKEETNIEISKIST